MVRPSPRFPKGSFGKHRMKLLMFCGPTGHTGDHACWSWASWGCHIALNPVLQEPIVPSSTLFRFLNQYPASIPTCCALQASHQWPHESLLWQIQTCLGILGLKLEPNLHVSFRGSQSICLYEVQPQRFCQTVAILRHPAMLLRCCFEQSQRHSKVFRNL